MARVTGNSGTAAARSWRKERRSIMKPLKSRPARGYRAMPINIVNVVKI
jgi:hypothetical protein